MPSLLISPALLTEEPNKNEPPSITKPLVPSSSAKLIESIIEIT